MLTLWGTETASLAHPHKGLIPALPLNTRQLLLRQLIVHDQVQIRNQQTKRLRWQSHLRWKQWAVLVKHPEF